MFVDEKALPEAPVKQLEPWQEACLKAADYIDLHGWCRGKPRDHEGKVCLIGALRLVTDGTIDVDFKRSEARVPYEYLQSRLGGVCPVAWNDHPIRKKEQVTAFLRSVV